MNIGDSHEHHRDMKVYNDVMGIALAIWSNAGDCALFTIVDKALDDFNLQEMELIRDAFEALPSNLRRDLMSEAKTISAGVAISRLEENVIATMRAKRPRSA